MYNRNIQCRKIEISLISASDLEDVRFFGMMKVYAVVSIGGNSRTEKRTPVDYEGSTNPAWNFTIKYTVDEMAMQNEGVMLDIKLYCERTLGDRYIGEVNTSIKQLYDHAQANEDDPVLSYPVQKGSTTSQGDLKFSCSFGETVIIKIPSFWKKFFMVGAIILLCGMTIKNPYICMKFLLVGAIIFLCVMTIKNPSFWKKFLMVGAIIMTVKNPSFWKKFFTVGAIISLLRVESDAVELPLDDGTPIIIDRDGKVVVWRDGKFLFAPRDATVNHASLPNLANSYEKFMQCIRIFYPS